MLPLNAHIIDVWNTEYDIHTQPTSGHNDPNRPWYCTGAAKVMALGFCWQAQQPIFHFL